MNIKQFTTILILLGLLIVSCEKKTSHSADIQLNLSDRPSSELSDEPCDDPEATKIEISDEGINLLDEEEGCKLPE